VHDRYCPQIHRHTDPTQRAQPPLDYDATNKRGTFLVDAESGESYQMILENQGQRGIEG